MADDTIETAIVAALGGEATITAIIGTSPVRLYPLIAEQGAALPYIVYQQISGVRDYTMDGPTGYVDARYQITCWAATYGAAKRLFEVVRKFFNGYHATVLNRKIQYIAFENELDRLAKTPGVDAIDIFGKQIDIKITFDEPTS